MRLLSGSVPALAQWVNDPGVAVSCGVGCRRGSDPTLLWLWRRPVATAPIRPLAWEPPYAAGAAQEIAKRQKKKKKKKKAEGHRLWASAVLMGCPASLTGHLCVLIATFKKA